MTAWSEGNVQANGITIHYHRTGGNSKPFLLLLHGITDSGLCWSRAAHDLEDSYNVIMTDARGHGHSGTSATAFSIALLADDAAAVIRASGAGHNIHRDRYDETMAEFRAFLNRT